MAARSEGYDGLLGRVTELEVDLASAVAGLERAQSDGMALREIHTDLVNAYKRLQEQHERVRHQLRQEQEERQKLADEQQRQVALWRAQLGAKAQDFEDLQAHLSAPRELDAIRLQLAEEIEEPYRLKVRALEGQLTVEQKKVKDIRRQVELMRIEHDHKDKEHEDQMGEHTRRHKLREQVLERKVGSLEAEVHAQRDAVAAAAHARVQLHEKEANITELQRALQEQESRSNKERAKMTEELRGRVDELSAARRRTHELQVQFDEALHRQEQISSDCEGLRREHSKLTTQLDAAKANIMLMRPAEESERLKSELVQLRHRVEAEREELNTRIGSVDGERQSVALALQHAEGNMRRLKEEQAEREHQMQTDREEAERSNQTAIATLQKKFEEAEREISSTRQAWRDREVSLKRQIDDASSHMESVTDELAECQTAQEEAEHRFREVEREYQQREADQMHRIEADRKELARRDAEIATLRDSVAQLERERSEKTSEAEAALSAIRTKEQQCDVLQVEVATLSKRLDVERAQWVRDAEEASTAALREEETRRSTAVALIQEEHKKQLVKFQATSKRALQRAARKRQDMRQRCQELARRIVQLQQEKAVAVRICEENKSAYELQLAGVGLASRCGSASDTPMASVALRLDSQPQSGSATRSRELRSIMERLQADAERFRSSQGSVDLANIASSPMASC